MRNRSVYFDKNDGFWKTCERISNWFKIFLLEFC